MAKISLLRHGERSRSALGQPRRRALPDEARVRAARRLLPPASACFFCSCRTPSFGERGSTARTIAMGEHIERLAQFVAQTQWEDVPAPVQRHTKLVLLDTLGVILAGGERPEVRQLRDRLAANAGTGATVYARGWPTQD